MAVINVQRVDHKKRRYSSRVFATALFYSFPFFTNFLAAVMIDKIRVFTFDRIVRVFAEYASSTTSTVLSFILTGDFIREKYSECFSLL